MVSKMTILKVSIARSPIFEFFPKGERREDIFSEELTILVAYWFYQWQNE